MSVQSDFEARFDRFILERVPASEKYDQPGRAAAGGRVADYLLFERSVVLELKCLANDATPKAIAFAERVASQRGLIAYGEVPVC